MHRTQLQTLIQIPHVATFSVIILGMLEPSVFTNFYFILVNILMACKQIPEN